MEADWKAEHLTLLEAYGRLEADRDRLLVALRDLLDYRPPNDGGPQTTSCGAVVRASRAVAGR